MKSPKSSFFLLIRQSIKCSDGEIFVGGGGGNFQLDIPIFFIPLEVPKCPIQPSVRKEH